MKKKMSKAKGITAMAFAGALAVTALPQLPKQALAADSSTANTTCVTSYADTLCVRRGRAYFFKYDMESGNADVIAVYGREGDVVFVGDWDGDGVDTICVRRGNVYYFKNSLTAGNADEVVTYGRADDEALVGDWDGDGVDTLAVRRGRTYYVSNSIKSGNADKKVIYGRATDTVLVGDWDGDGFDTLAVRRGNMYYISNTIKSGNADKVVCYGRSTDEVLVGDWDGDNIDTLAVRRGNIYYISNTIKTGNADKEVIYGRKGDEVYAGQWQDNVSHDYEVTDSADATCTTAGYIIYTCKDCGYTYTKTVAAKGHTWEEQQGSIKFGYACNACNQDVTDWEDKYACHGGYHTHTWCIIPDHYQICTTCGQTAHSHTWYWVDPEYYTDSDAILVPGHYKCSGCLSYSFDGENIDNTLTGWTTPYDFSNENVILTTSYTEPARDGTELQYIRISSSVNSMVPGDTAQLSVSYTPSNATTDHIITWSSSDSSVISVDQNGLITAVQTGTAEITATTTDGKSAARFIRVTEENIGVVSSAKLLVDGEDVTSATITLEKDTSHILSLETVPGSAVYEVRYTTSVGEIINITGSILKGSLSTYNWENTLNTTDPSSEFDAYDIGQTELMATITDMNGNVTTVSVTIIVK